MQKGKISHSIECMIEYGRSHLSELKQFEAYNFIGFPLFFKDVSLFR